MIDQDLLKSSIEDNKFISSFIHVDEVNSTNTFAKRKEIPVDSIIVTGYQSAGKGRLGRKWVSEKQSNLTFSIKKKLPFPPSDNQFAVFYFSYHLYSAIKKTLHNKLTENEIKSLQIKWPNDLLFNWKKLSGILIESILPEGIYIIGIGVNCNQTRFPEELSAISLKQIIGTELNLTELLLGIISEFTENFHDLEGKNYSKIYENWKSSTEIVGKNCEFQVNQHNIKHGKIIDLNEDGSISIESQGKIFNYFSGNIKLKAITQP